MKEYRRRFPWVWSALEKDSESRSLSLADVFPADTPERRAAKLEEVTKWLKSQPSAKRPLVKDTVQMASDAAVDKLQMVVLNTIRGSTLPVQYENVQTSLLLPPYDPALPSSVLAGAGLELGDRVVVLKATGSPPFGSRGSVIGLFDDAVELLMDHDFPGRVFVLVALSNFIAGLFLACHLASIDTIKLAACLGSCCIWWCSLSVLTPCLTLQHP